MRQANTKLNKEVVIRHKKGESFGDLSIHYKRSKSTLHEMFHRHKDKYLLPTEKKTVRI